ncbi:putative ABC transport system permease protein [Saccharothrix carnea]|uniref:Putative ABC transport system permease protein n=1 Tax=Saccharothrix carnea TaxID=1280637 RepID=A0A2P8I2U6_SACCR|nr:ABC transporter permease [Saccharothrix carnea]PSL52789.1 putative ABC transport system permease protein [Saccharothrix carnea]
MSALSRVVRSGVARRRVQTVVIGLATTMAVTSSVLGGSLLVASTAPFDDAFAEQRGAHLSAVFDAGKATPEQLSVPVDGVTASAGPFPVTTITPSDNGPGRNGAGGQAPGGQAPLTVAGRTDPGGGPVDAVTLTEGEWADEPGELVVSADGPHAHSPTGSAVGRRITLTDGSTLTVVGLARSVSRTADGWVPPSWVTAPESYQVLYRFTAAESVDAGREAVVAAVPADAMTGSQSWLVLKKAADRSVAVFVPFLVAFGVLGLVMSLLVVGNVVAGAVGAGTRRIGILKALGSTPAQVVRAYMAQALIPAAVGTAIGAVAGNLLAIPVLAETEDVYGAVKLTVAPWVNVVVVVGALALVSVTAWVSALRAGRLRTVDAIAVGRTPRPGRGRWAARLTARLPVPRPVGLGLARPFARPARAAAMTAAVLFGATAVTFAVGLASSLNQIQIARDHDAADVTIGVSDPGPQPGSRPGGRPAAAPDPAAVSDVIAAQAGTRAHYRTSRTQVTVTGVAGTTAVVSFTGDATWDGYQLVSGRWFTQPGEAVAPTPFLAATGTEVGDTVTLDDGGKTVTVRIVGDVFEMSNDGMVVLTDAATLTAGNDAKGATHHIAVQPGTDVNTYIDSLNAALAPLGATARPGRSGQASDTIILINSLTATLTLMLVAVAAMGVLNAVVLDTRDRIRDLGVHKALGMTPRQTIAMVIASVVVIGVVGGAVGVPAGVALHGAVLPAMGESAGIGLPASAHAVHSLPELVLLGIGGLLIAIVGASLPATWAARTSTATALRTE